MRNPDAVGIVGDDKSGQLAREKKLFAAPCGHSRHLGPSIDDPTGARTCQTKPTAVRPPPLRRPDQSAARGGPRPSWPCRVAPQLRRRSRTSVGRPAGSVGVIVGQDATRFWRRESLARGGRGSPSDWIGRRRGGACDGIVDAGARGHEGWSAVVGSSLDERTDKAFFFSFSCSCFPIVVLLPVIL